MSWYNLLYYMHLNTSEVTLFKLGGNETLAY